MPEQKKNGNLKKISKEPWLENGDHLERAVFERRLANHSSTILVERIEGVVRMATPSRLRSHASPHHELATWLGVYRAVTPGTNSATQCTLQFDDAHDFRPDVVLFIRPENQGRVTVNSEDILQGGPELVVEVCSSEASQDLNAKMLVYQQNDVREYLVWQVQTQKLEWFIQRETWFEPLVPDAEGIIRSETFPGLWLDVPALLRHDLVTVLRKLHEGVADPAHNDFVQTLHNLSEERSE